MRIVFVVSPEYVKPRVLRLIDYLNQLMPLLAKHFGKIFRHHGVSGEHLQDFTWIHSNELAFCFENGPGAAHAPKINNLVCFSSSFHNRLQLLDQEVGWNSCSAICMPRGSDLHIFHMYLLLLHKKYPPFFN